MTALVMHGIGLPLKVEQIQTPTIADDQVLVKVEACGVCHTDEFLSRVGFPGLSFPHVLGHEGSGTIAQVGSKAEGWAVFVPMFGGSCGDCGFCQRDLKLQCAKKKAHAIDIWGCYAEYVVANPKAIVRIPDNVTFEQAGPCGCAGATMTAAIRRANPPAGGWIGFSGAGGLGLMGIQVAKALGYKVASIDVDDVKLKEAKAVGADVLVNARKAGANLGEEVKKATDGGLDAHLLVTTAPIAFENAPSCMRGGGAIVFLGIVEGDIKLTPLTILVNDMKIIGSQIGNPEDAEMAVKLVAEGKVRPITSTCKLSEVPHIFEELEKGTIIGRKVVTDFS
ncbi:NAD+-dependent and Zn-containing alcohol dehydrogenase [Hyaloraphidium curvatum]|nr:NAD+-dependent and Zn-containing alcohol dehydrogenase [Hyaloraphidium curvatum]